MILILKIVVGLLTLAVVVLKDYNQAKDPFDQDRKKFDWKKEWWRWRKDNVAIMVVMGLVGWFLAGELAIPIVNKYLEWPELAENSIDLSGVAIVVFFFARFLPRLIGFK